MAQNPRNKAATQYLYIDKSFTLHPYSIDFRLHNHRDMLEILVFLAGDAQFRVEGSVYPLAPYDTVVVSNHEMHRVVHLSDTPYKRIVINLPAAFFMSNECEEYAGLFFDRPLGEGNLISREITQSSRFRDCTERLLEYKSSGESETLVKSVFIEFLHILNKSRQAEESLHKEQNLGNRHIREVISYINENLTSDITLESISKQFFMNKSYLCRAFKKHTGYTLNKYITHKRLLYVRELCSQNMSITQASMEAGFGNYSNFYKMYLQENGQPPSVDLK